MKAWPFLQAGAAPGPRTPFKTESDGRLVHFKYEGVFRKSAVVEISEVGRTLPQLPLFVLFGWHLAIMLDRDSDSDSTASVLIGVFA